MREGGTKVVVKPENFIYNLGITWLVPNLKENADIYLCKVHIIIIEAALYSRDISTP